MPVSTQASAEFETAIDSLLAPIEIDELNDPIGPRAAGQPHRVDEFRGRLRKTRNHVPQAARELLSA